MQERKDGFFKKAPEIVQVVATIVALGFVVLGFAIAMLNSWFGIYPQGFLVRSQVAVDLLTKDGFKNIVVTDRSVCYIQSWKGGGSRDVVRFTLNATNAAGVDVKDIHIFSGWPFKGATKRE